MILWIKSELIDRIYCTLITTMHNYLQKRVRFYFRMNNHTIYMKNLYITVCLFHSTRGTKEIEFEKQLTFQKIITLYLVFQYKPKIINWCFVPKKWNEFIILKYILYHIGFPSKERLSKNHKSLSCYWRCWTNGIHRFI